MRSSPRADNLQDRIFSPGSRTALPLASPSELQKQRRKLKLHRGFQMASRPHWLCICHNKLFKYLLMASSIVTSLGRRKRHQGCARLSHFYRKSLLEHCRRRSELCGS